MSKAKPKREETQLEMAHRLDLDGLISCGRHIGGRVPNEFDAWDMTCEHCTERLRLISRVVELLEPRNRKQV